jgi:hypothetical protein
MQIRIDIDGKRLELESPISGVALYAAARVQHEQVLYRETAGDREDELVLQESAGIELKVDEHFYSSRFHHHPPEHSIIVNARPKTVVGRKISFEKVVKLAFPDGPPTPQTVYTVAYGNGPPKNREGKMVAGQTVRIKNDMVFDVTETSRS